jgi:anti-anti-sigma factor
MTQWNARWRRVTGGDLGRPADPRMDMATVYLRLAQRTVDGARSQAAYPTEEFVVDAHHDGDALIIVLAGEFDLATAHRVRETLTRAMSEPRRRLTVDLSEVTFMDSSGVHVMLDLHKLCRDTGSTLSIRPGPPNVQRVFELTRLVDYLPFEFSG